MNPVCIYDGITVFVKDNNFTSLILDAPQKYNLQVTTDSVSGYQYGFKGRFKNFTIRYFANKRGKGIVLGGSLHKWKNKSHNYDVFLWDDFLAVYYDFLNEFDFDPYQTDIWRLEGGLNNSLPDTFQPSIKELAENILLLKEDGKNVLRRKFSKEGYSLDVSKGECDYKFYDKGRQFSLPNKVLRTECSCQRRPLEKHGLTTFADLVDYEKHTSFGKRLLSSFETLLIFQPEILQAEGLSVSDRDFLLQHNNTNSWVRVKKGNYYQYKSERKHFFSLIDKYCAVNYRTEVLNLMQSQLS